MAINVLRAKTIFIFIVLLLVGTKAMAQHPEVNWQEQLGGTDGDLGNDILQTPDSGYIAVGTTYSSDEDVTGYHGGGDIWVVKMDNNGKIQWQRTLGGSGNDRGYSIVQANDGGYVIAGTTNSVDGNVTGRTKVNNLDWWIVKLDNKGAIVWQKVLGGSADDMAYSLAKTYDGNYIVAGVTKSQDGDVVGFHLGNGFDGWVVKLDTHGNKLWQKVLGGSRLDVLNSIAPTTDGGYITAGTTNSPDGDVQGRKPGNGFDLWAVKLDDTGGVRWQKTLGGTGYDQATSVKETLDGKYIICGATTSDNGDVTDSRGDRDGWVVKLNSNGALMWQKTLGGRFSDGLNCVTLTKDSGYVVAGFSGSDNGDIANNKGGVDMWTVKLGANGSFIWQKPVGGSNEERANAIEQTFDKGYIIVGSSESNDGDANANHGSADMWVVKLTSPYRDMPVFDHNKSGITVFPEQTNEIIYVGLPRDYKGAQINITDANGGTVEFSDTPSYYRIIHILKATPGLLTLHITKGDKKETFDVTYKPQ